jgi:hypothetical protein
VRAGNWLRRKVAKVANLAHTFRAAILAKSGQGTQGTQGTHVLPHEGRLRPLAQERGGRTVSRSTGPERGCSTLD